MDAHVPQCKGVVRLKLTAAPRRWLPLALAIVWALLLAIAPWWIGVPLLLALAITQLTHAPRLQRFSDVIRVALRWGFAGVLVASYRAFGGHALGLTFTLLAALVGFSLLVLLESWQRRKPLRNAALAAESPEWREMAMAPVGPSATIIEVDPPVWTVMDELPIQVSESIERVADQSYRVSGRTKIQHVEPRLSLSKEKTWVAWPLTAGRGVLLYDRARDRVFRFRGWQLFGWCGDEAWLTRGDDQAPLALSHVLGQDHIDE